MQNYVISFYLNENLNMIKSYFHFKELKKKRVDLKRISI
jgi:hypothetical protein